MSQIRSVTKTWLEDKFKDEEVRDIATKYNISTLSARVLIHHNIHKKSDEDIRDFLNPTEKLLLDSDGLTLPNHFQNAVDRIKKAISSKTKIMINGDPDADGITGTTILFVGLEALGAQPIYSFPTRTKEGHGLQPKIIDKANHLGADLILTVDCGSKDIKATAYANKKGIDVIICDHHIIAGEKPNAHAIINPHLIPDSKLKTLAGAGVALKFIVDLAKALNIDISNQISYMTSLAALGTISDRMSCLSPINR